MSFDDLKLKIEGYLKSDTAKRAFHTLWQAAGGVLLTGLLAAHSSHDVKLALSAAFAAALSALKGILLG